MTFDELWAWVATQQGVAAWPPHRALLEGLGERLHAIDRGLAFEVCRRGERSEFAISADGNPDLFDLVRDVVDAAPPLPVDVVAFRQRGPIGSMRLKRWDGGMLEAADIWYQLDGDARDGIGLRLFIRDFPMGDEAPGPTQNAVYILLDNALGELDVVANVAWIAWAPLPDAPETVGLSPLVQLPAEFDRALGRGPRAFN